MAEARRSGLWLLLCCAACQNPLHDLSSLPESLFVVHGRLTQPINAPSTAKLRAALLWAGVPVYVPYCHDHGPDPRDPTRVVSKVAAKACRDPFEVVPAQIGPSIPFDPSAMSFEISLSHLPDAAVMIGALPSRVAYASLIIFDDVSGDGTLNFQRGCGFRGGGPGFGVDAGEFDSGQLMPSLPREPIYASSFFSLTQEQTRIAYVEGPFNATSFYYPHPSGCQQTPPEGFSIWTVGSLLDGSAGCALEAIDQPISLSPMDTGLVDLSCPEGTRDAFPRPPPNRLPGPEVLWECTAEGAIAVADTSCACPNLRLYTLRGCYNDDACPTPDWDIPMPAQWPCPPAPGKGGS